MFYKACLTKLTPPLGHFSVYFCSAGGKMNEVLTMIQQFAISATPLFLFKSGDAIK